MRASRDRIGPDRAISAVAARTLKSLHRYCGLESLKSLEEFSHPKQLRNFRILASDFGQHETIKDWDCIDETGEKIPWYTYPAYEFIDSLDLHNLRITEYGSGNSSLFYLRKAAILTSIENNEEWYHKISRMTDGEKNFTYRLFADPSSYAEQPSVTDADVVIIDGWQRNACARFVCQSILDDQSDPYLIIFDNSDWYPKTVASMSKKLAWQQVDFSGFGPINNYCWTTSILFNPRKRLNGRSSIEPIGGIQGSPDDDVEFA